MFPDLQQEIDAGYVTKRKHPTLDLWIYNYSAACQFDRHWTPTTIACRGLVLDAQDRRVACSFPKFFNREEHEGTLPDGRFIVTDKMDGSMILLFWYRDEWVVATRGSFESDQAQMARDILNRKYREMLDSCDLMSNVTYVFELIHPRNRIVVDYEDTEDLVFLTCIDNATGRDISHDTPEVMAQRLHIRTPVAKAYDGITDLEKIRELGQKNQEGFVTRWLDSGYRLKWKLADYVRLHKLLTGVTAFRIWDMLQSGQDFNAWLEGVPDEFYRFVQNISTGLKQGFREIEDTARQEYREFPTRKESAQYFQTCRYPAVLFKMLDRKPYDDLIWKLLRPRGDTQAFRCDRDS